MGSTHLATGFTTGAWFAYALPGVHDHWRPVLGLVAAGAALAPDIDHVKARASRSFHDARLLSWAVTRFGGHRTWTHDLRIGPPLFAVVVAVAVWFVDGPIGDLWWAFALAMLVGCVTHVWGDARTTSGVPLGRRRIRLGRTFTTGTAREQRLYRLLYRPAAIGSVVATVALTYGSGV